MFFYSFQLVNSKLFFLIILVDIKNFELNVDDDNFLHIQSINNFYIYMCGVRVWFCVKIRNILLAYTWNKCNVTTVNDV